MRSFVILYLVAIVYGSPIDINNLGYNYNIGQELGPENAASGSNSNGAVLATSSSGNHNALLQPTATSLVQKGSDQEPLISKQFFIHSAPEETEVQHKHFVLGRPQKNYRVVFIKAPASSNSNLKLSAEYAPTEEKTHIFVLTKKEPELNVNDIVTPAPTQPSKPEVFFVKYRTPEEAKHAQQRIQDQYDLLGGTSQISDEGVAPISSVIGALGNSDELASSSSNQDGIRAGGAGQYLPPKSSYLPPVRI